MTNSPWILVKDALPEPDELVVCFFPQLGHAPAMIGKGFYSYTAKQFGPLPASRKWWIRKPRAWMRPDADGTAWKLAEDVLPEPDEAVVVAVDQLNVPASFDFHLAHYDADGHWRRWRDGAELFSVARWVPVPDDQIN